MNRAQHTNFEKKNSQVARINETASFYVIIEWKVKGHRWCAGASRSVSITRPRVAYGEQRPGEKKSLQGIVFSGDSSVEIRAKIRQRYGRKDDIPIVAAQQKYSPA